MWKILAAALLAAAFSDDFTGYLSRGIEESKEGKSASAMIDLQAAMRLNPKAPAVYFRMGLLFGQMSDFKDAESAFRRATELNPSFAEAYYNLGLTQIGDPQSKLDWPAAIGSFRAALQCRPDYAEAANYLGAGLMATGDVDGALGEFQKAAQMNPSLAEAHFNLGLALERKERLAEAQTEYRRAVEDRHGNYPEASTALAKMLLHAGDLTLARQQALNALRLNPDSSDAHNILARIAQAQKMPSEAKTELEQVHELVQRRTNAIQSSRVTNEGLEAAANGDMAAALKLERQAVELKPDFGIAHYNLALILADTGDSDSAAREFVKAGSLLPASAAPWFNLGRVLRRKGDLRGSLAALSWAARLAPSDDRVNAEIKEAGGNLQPVPVTQPPLGPPADTVDAHLAFALELAASGDHLGAAGEFLRVLALDPANQKGRRQLAGAYRQLKLTQAADLEMAKLELIHP